MSENEPKEVKKEPKRESNFGIYSGNELLNKKTRLRVPIINSFLYEMDQCMIVAKEKVGKSILALQMAMCISSGTDFLDQFEVPTALPTLYVQSEGKFSESLDRIRRMDKAIEMRPENFGLIYTPKIRLNHISGREYLTGIIDKAIQDGGIRSPKVIFLDCLYKLIDGSCSDDEVASNFTDNLMILADRYKAAIVLIHHEHKTKRDDKGKEIHERGGEASMGSFAYAAHIDIGFRMRKTATKVRVLEPWADRDEKVCKKLDLSLVDGGPLFYTIKNDQATASFEMVKWQIEKLKITTTKQLVFKTKLSRETINKALRHWLDKKVIERVNPHHNPAKFKIKGGK